MVNERVFKIAETGQIPANDPVSNIMSQVEIKQDGEPGLWGSFKKWAGSKGGRMTLGGLGTALGVGLSGGDFRDALGYGVIGAGNTAKTMYRNEQDAKHWVDREAQRNLYWQNYEAGRRLQRELQNERIEAQKEQTAAQYQNALNQLAAQYQYNQMGLDAAEARAEKRQNKLLDDLGVEPTLRPHLTALMNGINLGGAMENYYRNILLDPNSTPEARAAAEQYFEASKSFDAMMRPPLNLKDAAGIAKDAGLTLDVGATNNGQIVFAEKPKNLPDDAQMINYYISKGYSPDEARQYVGALSPAEKTKEALNLSRGQALIDRGTHAANAGVDFNYGQRAANAQTGRDMYMADYKAQIAEEKASNDIMRSAMLEVFKNGLSDTEQKKIQAYARFNNISEDEATARVMDAVMQKQIAEAEKAQKEAAVAGMTQQMQNAEYLNANPNLSEEARGVFKTQGTTVNVGQNQDAFNTQMGKNMATDYQNIQDAGRNAQRQLITMKAMYKAFDNPAVYQGTGGALVNGFKKFLSSIGVPVEGMDDAAIINSGKTQLMGTLRKDIMPGALSAQELQFLVDIVPELGKLPEQNKAIANLFMKAYQRQEEAAAFANRYYLNHKTWDAQGQQELAQYFASKPAFTEEEKAAAMGQKNNSAAKNIAVKKSKLRLVGVR